MQSSEFKNLLEKYQQGTCSPEEAQLVEKWLDSLAGDENAFEALAEEEKNSLKNTMKAAIRSEVREPEVSKRPFSFAFWSKVAASLLLIAGLAYLFWNATQKNTTPIATIIRESTGTTHKIILPDGSLVWLKGSSRLGYPSEFGEERVVTLQGEALFEVAKDASHPFIIHCGSLTTKVLGTSFNIRSRGKQTEVAVLTGKVTLSANGTTNLGTLTPNEKAVYWEASQTMQKQRETQASTYTKGTEYVMSFDDAALATVMQRIEDKFNVTVQAEGSQRKACLITADFTDQSLAKTLDLITQTLNGKYEIKGDTVSMKGLHCE